MIYAGFWIRFLAHVIDFVLINAVELALEYGVSTPLNFSSFSQQILGVVLTVGLSYWYYCVFQVRHGQTIGKRLFSIYVVDENTGAFLNRKQAVIRLVGYLLSYAIIGCGFLMAAFHPQKRALHDLLAGTVSVRRPKSKVDEAVAVASVANPT